MKIISALKQIKANRDKIDGIAQLIRQNSARMEGGSTGYENPVEKMKEWENQARSLLRENETLARRIARTNSTVKVDIEIDGKVITKTITEWLHRRTEGVDREMVIFTSMSDQGLSDKAVKDANGSVLIERVQRFYDVAHRDETKMVLNGEKSLIDSALEIVNATTDLLED